MADVRPFICVRPNQEAAAQVAALPYDVYSRQEAKAAVAGHPLSFLNIDRPETQYGEDFDMYSDEAYETARRMLEQEIADGTFVVDEDASYYIYELIMDGRSQTGITACCSIDDYLGNVIKKHENTLAAKEQDRIRHIDACSAQTGPIFLAYRRHPVIAEVIRKTKETAPLYDFVSEDGISHRVWKITDAADTAAVQEAFAGISSIYIADGHHRCASAVKVGLARREKFGPGGEYDHFMAVLFADDELKILPYNRVVADLAGMTEEEFLTRVRAAGFTAEKTDDPAYTPAQPGVMGMRLSDGWYVLTAGEKLRSSDPVKGLDVSILQDHLLDPILGIRDPKTDSRISFVGGIRGTGELNRLVNGGAAAAFSMYPTQISQLLAVADANQLMPPKSTWFEPKLRSGLFIHRI